MVQLINDSNSWVIITTQFLPDVLIVPGVLLKELKIIEDASVPLFSVITSYTFFCLLENENQRFSYMPLPQSNLSLGLSGFWKKVMHPGSFNKTLSV